MDWRKLPHFQFSVETCVSSFLEIFDFQFNFRRAAVLLYLRRAGVLSRRREAGFSVPVFVKLRVGVHQLQARRLPLGGPIVYCEAIGAALDLSSRVIGGYRRTRRSRCPIRHGDLDLSLGIPVFSSRYTGISNTGIRVRNFPVPVFLHTNTKIRRNRLSSGIYLGLTTTPADFR